MADGTTKPIEAVREGELVLAYDVAAGQFQPDTVKHVLVHKDFEEGYLILNGHLKVTANHPIHANGGWVEAGQLRLGDNMLNAHGQLEPVTSIEHRRERVTVHNFEVNPFHTYVANGLVVHNAIKGPI